MIIARRQLIGGTVIKDENIKVSGLVSPGHKIATRDFAVGEPVRRYNQIIGVASQTIAPGQHVHTHNLAMAEFAGDYVFSTETRATDYVISRNPPRLWVSSVRTGR